MFRRAGFTLLEICIAIFIGMLLITIAVPSVSAMLAEQRLKATFDRFDAFVGKARERSVSERRAYLIEWEDDGLTMLPAERRDTDDPTAAPERFAFARGESFTIERPSALMKKPAAEWVFWRSGLCEESLVSFAGEAGSWRVHYDPLTARGTFLDSEVKR